MSLSIIIPMYNVEKYIAETIESFIEHLNFDFEVIAINDGSSDNTKEIIEEYAKIYSSIRVYNFENGGLSVARNRGISLATKKYVIFLDSDDKIAAKNLNTVYKTISEDGLDCVFYNSEVFFEEAEKENFRPNYKRPQELTLRTYSGKELFIEFLKARSYFVSACMYIFRLDAIDKLRFFPGIYFEDNLFTTQLLLLNSDLSFRCVDECVYNRRVRSGSIMTSNVTKKHVQDYLTIYKYLGELYFDDKLTMDYLDKYRLSILYSAFKCAGKISKSSTKEVKKIYRDKHLSLREPEMLLKFELENLYSFISKTRAWIKKN